jgi:hypothetical protein
MIVLGIGAIATAAPRVEIKAQTQLSLTSVRLQPDGTVEVIGQLIDKLTGEGIPHRRVTVTVAGERTVANTDSSGNFKVIFDRPEAGPQRIGLAFGGADHVDAAPPLEITTDPAKQHVALAIAKIDDVPDGVRLVVTAKIDNQAITVPVQLAVGAASDATLAPLRAEQTNQPFVLRRADAGGAGTHRLRASFLGDDSRQATSAELTLELASVTTTTMTVSATTLAYEDDLVVTGRVADDDGHAVGRAAVTLAAGDRRLAQGATLDDGSYKLRVEASVLGEGQFGVQVAAEPAKSYVKSSRSQPVVIRIAAPSPVPVSYTFAAFVATAFAAGGFFLARTKPWQRLRRPAPPAEVPSQEGEIEAAGGLVVAKPSIVSTLRRPSDDGFSGVVRDTVRGRPIAEAVVRLILGDAERELRTGADGSFTIEKLATGVWQAEVAASGHVTERFAVTVPHRGELRGVRVDLVPVRERVFQLYRRAAEPILPEARLWGIWSPRQIVDHVRSKRPTPALAELTDFVEEVYFSNRANAETVLPHAQARVDRAIKERAHGNADTQAPTRRL